MTEYDSQIVYALGVLWPGQSYKVHLKPDLEKSLQQQAAVLFPGWVLDGGMAHTVPALADIPDILRDDGRRLLRSINSQPADMQSAKLVLAMQRIVLTSPPENSPRGR